MIVLRDDIGKEHLFSCVPKSIISLCPSLTETLFDMGLGAKVIGITDYCLYPKDEVQRISRVGGPKTILFDAIDLLKPEVILAIKEECSKDQIEQLSKEFKVIVFDIETFNQGLQMILKLGALFNVEELAHEMANQISCGLDSIPHREECLSCLYLVWKNPWMAAGKNTFIDSVLQKIGFINIVNEQDRYPSIDITNCKADVVFLPSEPYSFGQNEKKYLEGIKGFGKVFLVDGEMFCWPGSHLLKSIEYFKELIKQL